jgi:hypothetical protein
MDFSFRLNINKSAASCPTLPCVTHGKITVAFANDEPDALVVGLNCIKNL